MNNIMNTTEEMIKVIDEAQKLVIKEFMDNDLFSEIVDNEMTLNAMVLANKSIKVSKDYAVAQAEWTVETDERFVKIENQMERIEENQVEISRNIERLYTKIDELVCKFEESTNKE